MSRRRKAWVCPATGGPHDFQQESDDRYPQGYIKCTECNAGSLNPTKPQRSRLWRPNPGPDLSNDEEWSRSPSDPGARSD